MVFRFKGLSVGFFGGVAVACGGEFLTVLFHIGNVLHKVVGHRKGHGTEGINQQAVPVFFCQGGDMRKFYGNGFGQRFVERGFPFFKGLHIGKERKVGPAAVFGF